MRNFVLSRVALTFADRSGDHGPAGRYRRPAGHGVDRSESIAAPRRSRPGGPRTTDTLANGFPGVLQLAATKPVRWPAAGPALALSLTSEPPRSDQPWLPVSYLSLRSIWWC